MRLGNTVDFPLAYLGAIAVGLVPVPTSAALTEPEVAHIIAELSPRLILRDPDVPCPDHPQMILTPQLQAMRAQPPAPFDMGDPERLAYIIYTSGTSGQPRAVAHAHRAIWARQMMFDGWYDLRASDRVLHAGAFNWTYTLGTGLMDPWTMGATALIPNNGTATGDLATLLGTHRASIFAAAPGVYRQLLTGRDALSLPNLRHGLSAGEKLPTRTAQAWITATGTQIYEAYGLSECSTFISANPAQPCSAEALGYAQTGRRVALLDEAGPVEIGTAGVIAVHRDDPGLMLGYLAAPQDTAQKMQGDWFLTGDQGVMAADGQITYLGRADDMMNAGGYRVSPIEVEQALGTHPDITGVGAAEVEVKADTRVIAAFYTSAAPLDAEALGIYVQSRLARYKQPRLFVHVDHLPMGANGKLQRRHLRAQWKATQLMTPIKLDIMSDPICPWCFIGKAHLDRALQDHPNHQFQIEWHPFQLNPDMPADGMDRRAYLEGKFGGKDGAVRAYAPVVENAAKAGLRIDFEGMKRTPNTLNAHRLIHWAGIEGRQTAAVSALFTAYFTEARDIGDVDVLADIADGIEMDAALVRRLMATSEDSQMIRDRDAHSRKMGISSVPTFIVAGKHAVPGAQPPELWAQVIAELGADIEV